jgi:hypothetical protein
LFSTWPAVYIFIITSVPPLDPLSHVKWVWAVFTEINPPELESDRSLPCSAGNKYVWSFICIRPYVFMAWLLIIYRSNFNFTYFYHYFVISAIIMIALIILRPASWLEFGLISYVILVRYQVQKERGP